MPSSRLRPFRYPAMLAAIGMLLAVGVAMVWGVKSLTRSAELVEQSYRVIGALDAAQNALRRAEGGARGYRRTGMAVQYADYRVAVPEVLERADEVVELTAGRSMQQQLAGRWREFAHARLAELERLIDPGRSAADDGTIVENDVLYGATRRVATAADKLRQVEQALLAERRETMIRGAAALTGFVVLGIVIPLILLVMTLSGLLRENRRTRGLEREARVALRELQSTLEERDRLSEQHRVLGQYSGLLQSCQTLEEAFAMTVRTMERLLPGAGGRCYALRSSQNLLESVATFGTPAVASTDLLAPDQCWALRRGHPHRTDGRHGHLPCAHLDLAQAAEGIWTLCVPLVAQGSTLGLLHVSAHEGDGRADSDTLLVEAVGEQLSLAMVNLELRETLRVQSLRDPLTGLFNRRYLEESLAREFQRCQRRGLPLSVLMIDIDHFKRFNDEHGHPAGDALLEVVGRVLAERTRMEDIACRYGGEEFIVILPEADSAAALQRAEQIRAAIASTTVEHLHRTLGPVTASIGIATSPGDGSAPGALVERADAALYQAKSAGRNRVTTAAAAKS